MLMNSNQKALITIVLAMIKNTYFVQRKCIILITDSQMKNELKNLNNCHNCNHFKIN